MNNITSKILIHQTPQSLSPKPIAPADNRLSADNISISGKQDDNYLKQNLLKQFRSDNNISTPQSTPLAEIPKGEVPKVIYENTKSGVFVHYWGTDGDDRVNLSSNEHKELIVDFNGHIRTFPGGTYLNKHNIIFDLGNGNNFLFTDPKVKYDINVNAGDGNNKITTGSSCDKINVGGGDNEIHGGNCGDTIKVKGNGNNIIFGDDGYDVIKIEGNGSNIIFGGSSNDVIEVKGSGNNKIHGEAGNDQIRVQGRGNNTLYGGDGEDLIEVKGSGNNEIHGEADNDRIQVQGRGHNKIYGGDGNDYMQGGNGNDYIDGGDGNDVIYGLDGNDTILGGAGNDYIDGGKDDDFLFGGGGENIISGGKGTDQIYGNYGSDVIINGEVLKTLNSKDKIHTYDSNNSNIANLGESIKIKGNKAFQARVESDLETLKALPSGLKMLEELDKTGKKVTIIPLQEDSAFASPCNKESVCANPNGTPNSGTNSRIEYNESFSLTNHSEDDLPPIGVLFHEMAHAYNYATGTFLKSNTDATEDSKYKNSKERACEHQAVGLPIKNLYNPVTKQSVKQEPIKHPDGTISYNNPKGLSENDLREDLNLAPRTKYH